MPKTQFLLEADEAKVVDAYLKVKHAQDYVTDSMRKMNKEGEGFGKVISGIAQIAGGFGLATSAVGLMRDTIGLLVEELEDMRRKESEAAKTQADFAKSFAPTIGQWLGADMIDKAYADLEGLRKKFPTLSPTSGQALLTAYAGTRAQAVLNPEEELARGMKAVEIAAPLAYGGVETAQLMGFLQKLEPKETTERLASLSTLILNRAGRFREQIPETMRAINQIVSTGATPEDAIAIALAAFESEQGGRWMTTIATLPAVLSEKVKKRIGVPYTPEEKIKLEFQKLPKEQQWPWIEAHPEKVEEIVGPRQQIITETVFKPGIVQAWKNAEEQAKMEDKHQKEIEDQRKSYFAIIDLIEARRTAAEEWQRQEDLEGGMKGFIAEHVKKFLEGMPEMGALNRRITLGTIEAKGRISGDYARAAIEELTHVRESFAKRTLEPIYISSEYGETFTGTRPNPRYNPTRAEAIDMLIGDIQTRAAAENKMRDPQQEDILKEQVVTNMLVKRLIDTLSQPNLSLKMMSHNSGMLD